MYTQYFGIYFDFGDNVLIVSGRVRASAAQFQTKSFSQASEGQSNNPCLSSAARISASDHGFIYSGDETDKRMGVL